MEGFIQPQGWVTEGTFVNHNKSLMLANGIKLGLNNYYSQSKHEAWKLEARSSWVKNFFLLLLLSSKAKLGGGLRLIMLVMWRKNSSSWTGRPRRRKKLEIFLSIFFVNRGLKMDRSSQCPLHYPIKKPLAEKSLISLGRRSLLCSYNQQLFFALKFTE